MNRLLFSLALLAACRDVSVVGEDFIESTNYELALNNSIPLEFSTIRYDSLVTSGLDRLVVGGQQGSGFGDFEVVSYFLVDLTGSEFDFRDNLVYDSITLSVVFDEYTVYLDEEIVRETLVVEQLANELEYPEDQFDFYNYTTISGITDLPERRLGEKEFFIASDRIRDLEVRLDDALGQDLFERLEAEDEIFTDSEEAAEYIKGLRIFLKNPAFLLGVSKEDLQLTIHTTDLNATSLSNVEINFPISSSLCFSKYIHEDIPEVLDVEDQDEQVSSETLSNSTLIVGGLGYATMVGLNHVRDLLLEEDDFILVNAEMRLRWLEQDHEDRPTSLTAQLVNEEYEDLALRSFVFQAEIDDEYGRDNFYVLDATVIVDFILNQPIGEEYYLLIVTEDFPSTPTSVGLGDESLDSELNIYTIKN